MIDRGATILRPHSLPPLSKPIYVLISQALRVRERKKFLIEASRLGVAGTRQPRERESEKESRVNIRTRVRRSSKREKITRVKATSNMSAYVVIGTDGLKRTCDMAGLHCTKIAQNK